MSANNKELRGSYPNSKEYEAYVDNELPDYIMVMLANNKTVHQINNDLQLFLGANTDRFTAWLHRAMSDPAVMMETTSEEREAVVPQGKEPSPLAGTKRKRSTDEEVIELEDYEDDWERESGPPTPPLEVAEAMVKAEEEKKRRERERGRQKKRKDEEEEEEGSPTKVIKLSAEDSKNRGQRSHVIVKKVIRVLQPPDFTRDQDLRELIAQRRKEKSYQDSSHKREDSDREENTDDDDDDDDKAHTASIASVVKRVHTERPRRTDKGGSRLLHRAILGIKPSERKSLKYRERETESSRSDRDSKDVRDKAERKTKDSKSKKHTTTSSLRSLSKQKVGGDTGEGGSGLEEVLVEVEEGGATSEGAFVDEFRQEQQLEKSKIKLATPAELPTNELHTDELSEIERSTLAAVKKVLPLGGRLRLTGLRTSKNGSKVLKSPEKERSKEKSKREDKSDGEEEKEEKEIDLREILNRKNKKGSESTTRFVVTLSGLGNNFNASSHSDLEDDTEEEEEEVTENDVRALKKVSLIRNHRFNSQAIEEIVSHQEQDVEEDYEDDRQGGRGLSGLPERCRFWPNCKNGDSCPFHHPSVACRMFPNCKYGNKCHFIHPQCKFDARCTRADCPYLHTAPRHLAFSSPGVTPPTAPPTMLPQPAFSSFSPRFSFGKPSPWQQSRPQRYPKKSALSWTPGTGKGGHVSERQFAVSDDQTTALPV